MKLQGENAPPADARAPLQKAPSDAQSTNNLRQLAKFCLADAEDTCASAGAPQQSEEELAEATAAAVQEISGARRTGCGPLQRAADATERCCKAHPCSVARHRCKPSPPAVLPLPPAMQSALLSWRRQPRAPRPTAPPAWRSSPLVAALWRSWRPGVSSFPGWCHLVAARSSLACCCPPNTSPLHCMTSTPSESAAFVKPPCLPPCCRSPRDGRP